jgi:hypothetical protein
VEDVNQAPTRTQTPLHRAKLAASAALDQVADAFSQLPRHVTIEIDFRPEADEAYAVVQGKRVRV